MNSGPQSGRTIDHFRLAARLGVGGMGIVYCAEDLLLRRRVAVKVMRPEFVEHARKRARFLREARTAASLVHPNIATIYEVGEAGGTIFIAMELVPGESLRLALARERPSAARAMSWAVGIARALAHAHQAGIVHRDLKPDNVMVLPSDDVKLLDFGIAKALTEDANDCSATPEMAVDAFTLDGAVLGTPQYVSPEQARGEAVDVRSDVFSFGSLLFEMLTGEAPFRRATVTETLAAVTRDRAPSLRAVEPSLPEALAAIVARCLEKEPADRFADAGELLAAMTAPLDGVEEPRGTSGGTRRRRAALVATAGLALAGAVGVRTLGAKRARAVMGARPASAAPTSIGFLDLQPSPTKSDDARSNFREAMRLFAEDRPHEAQARLDAARKLDPKFASAALQRAYLGFCYARALEEDDWAAYRDALALRGDLAPREADLLDGIAPSYRDPPDWVESESRLRAFVAARPGDAQGWDALGVVEMKLAHLADAARAFEREAEIAPKETAGVSVRVQALKAMGDTAGARRAAEECIVRDPTSVGCRSELYFMMDSSGDCIGMQRMAREMTLLSPGDEIAWYQRASAAWATGAPRDMVDGLYRKGLTLEPAATRAAAEIEVRAAYAWVDGDFTTQLRLYDQLDRVRRDASSSVLGATAAARAELLLQMGDEAAAGRAAEAFLQRAPALGAFEQLAADPTGKLISYLYVSGRIDAKERDRRRSAWIASWRARLTDDAWREQAIHVWMTAYARETEMPKSEAEEALAALPQFGDLPKVDYWGWADVPVLLAAGRLDEARARILALSRSCDSYTDPSLYYMLGRVLEESGDRDGACAGYAKLFATWPSPKPRSVYIDTARAHAAKLGCPPTDANHQAAR